MLFGEQVKLCSVEMCCGGLSMVLVLWFISCQVILQCSLCLVVWLWVFIVVVWLFQCLLRIIMMFCDWLWISMLLGFSLFFRVQCSCVLVLFRVIDFSFGVEVWLCNCQLEQVDRVRVVSMIISVILMWLIICGFLLFGLGKLVLGGC